MLNHTAAFLASFPEEELGDIEQKGMLDGVEYSPLEIARREHKTEVVAVLERFLVNPAQTRHELRVKLGVLDELAAQVFALTIFLCEDLLQIKPISTTNPAAAAAIRFFTLVKRLPMELQMILCHRVVGSAKEAFLSRDSDAAFNSLASVLLCQPQ